MTDNAIDITDNERAELNAFSLQSLTTTKTIIVMTRGSALCCNVVEGLLILIYMVVVIMTWKARQ